MSSFRPAPASGFTLIELLIGIALLSVVVLATAAFQRDIVIQNYFLTNSLIAEEEARLALKRIIRDLRTAAPAGSGDYPIALATANELTFFADTNGDGSRERVRYFIASTTARTDLRRGLIQPTGQPVTYPTTSEASTIVVKDIRNASTTGLFAYFGDDYDGSASSTALSWPVNIPDLRLVKVSLEIDANPYRSPVPFLFTSQVVIRNLKDNL